MLKRLAAFALILAASPLGATETLPPPGGKSIPVPQASTMAATFHDVGDCSPYAAAYAAAGLPRGNGVETIRQIDSLLRKRMLLRDDRGPDTWTPLLSVLISGKRPTGDCEDMAITTAQMAVCAGIPADRLGLLITTSPKGGTAEMHMLAFYKDAADKTWVFGDTFARPRPLSKVRERLVFMTYMTDVTRWHGLLGLRDLPAGTSQLPSTSAIPAASGEVTPRQCRAAAQPFAQ
ncbi:MAG: hypothetical protein R3D90_12160 [Paracoccaceae bacterium]